MAVSQSEKARKAREAAARKPKSNVTQLNAGQGGDGRVLTPGDNKKAAEAAEEAQLLSYLAVLRKQAKTVEDAKTVLDAAKEEMNATFGTAKNAGFQRKELTELLADTKVKGQRKNIEEAERRRNRFRRYCGLPVGDSETQQDLESRLPETKKDEFDWEADGYRAGVAGDEPTPTKDCVKAGFDQAWLKGYHNGQARNAWALSASKGLAPMPSVPPAASTAPAAPATTGEVIDLAAEKDVLRPDDFEASEDELAAQVGRKQPGDEGYEEGGTEPPESV